MTKAFIIGSIETDAYERIDVYNKMEDSEVTKVTVLTKDCMGERTLIQLTKDQAKEYVNLLQQAIYWSDEE